MERKENESKKLYIDIIEDLCYDFSLEEIDRIYQFVMCKWRRSPTVFKKYEAMREEKSQNVL